MSRRSRWVVLGSMGFLVALAGAVPAVVKQDEPRPSRRPPQDMSKSKSSRDREGRRPDEGAARDRDREFERLRLQVEELRRALDEERAARRGGREADETPEGKTPEDRPRDRDDRGPGAVEVARAQVEAAVAALEASEFRITLFERKLGLAARADDEMGMIDAELEIAEAKARVADARARVVEAESRLARARRLAEEAEEVVAEAGPDFTVDDALETADRVIDLLKSFRFEDRPR